MVGDEIWFNFVFIWQTIFAFFVNFWWLIAPLLLFIVMIRLFADWKKVKYFKTLEWATLEVKVPNLIEKPFKAMDTVFTALHIIYKKPKWKDFLFKERVLQEWYSFEIVSLAGEIYFIIKTPNQFRNLVEAQIYGQFPEAEINEIQDYTEIVPQDPLASGYNLEGIELKLSKADVYPLRTYSYFEDVPTDQIVYPLSSILEAMATLRDAEQAWVQILARPTGDDWKKGAEKEIAKITGRQLKEEKNFLEKIGEGFFHGLYNIVLKPTGENLPEEKEKEREGGEKRLTPGEREIVEAIERTTGKFGYECEIRILYLAPKENFNSHNLQAILGGFKQFSTQHLNSFKPNDDWKKKEYWPLKEKRKAENKMRLFKHYLARKFNSDIKPMILSTEELATIFHFPLASLKVPGLRYPSIKRPMPPGILPTEE